MNNQPPTAPVNPELQCLTVGCGTMLMEDGTCPRCNPPSRRSTAEKLQIARHYKDPHLQALAHAEVEAGIATGFEPGYEPHPPAPARPTAPPHLQQRPAPRFGSEPIRRQPARGELQRDPQRLTDADRDAMAQLLADDEAARKGEGEGETPDPRPKQP